MSFIESEGMDADLDWVADRRQARLARRRELRKRALGGTKRSAVAFGWRSDRAKQDDGRRSATMPGQTENFPVIREAVASFADQKHFRQAVGDLLTAGFEPSDLSVLAAHESLDVARGGAGYRKAPHSWLPTRLADEMKNLAPLPIAGILALSGGPVAPRLAARVSARLG